MIQKTCTLKNINRKVLGLILAGSVLFSICFEVFNFEYLRDYSVSGDFRLESPISAATNEEGYIAAIDSAGTRVSVITPDGNVQAIIQYSIFNTVAPSCEDSICIDDDTITILDHVKSKKHINGYYDRILNYDFNGKYIETSYTGKNQENMNLTSAAVHDNRTYVTAVDYYNDTIIIGEIKNEKLDTIHEFDFNYLDVFGIRYNPVSDMTTLLKNNGDIISWQGDKKTDFEFSKTAVVASDAVATDDGYTVAIDSTGDALIEFKSEDSIKKIASTEALNLSVCGKTILLSDQNGNCIESIDKNTGAAYLVRHLKYSGKIRLWTLLTWLILIIGIISMTLVIIICLMAIIDRMKATKDNAESAEILEDHVLPLTNIRLYGPLLGVAALAFAITAFMLGSLFYNKAVDTSRLTVDNVSSTLVQLSGETFGDSLESIDNQCDFGSTDYIKASASVIAACENNRTIEGITDLTYTLYKLKPGTDGAMMIIDYYGRMKVGTKLSSADQKQQGISDAIKSVREGNIVKKSLEYSSGVQYYESYAPIYDSEGEIVGLTSISINQSKFNERTLHRIMLQVVKAFTLLFGLVLLMVEFVLFGKFVRIKKKNDRMSTVNRTIPEAYRTMDVLFRIPAALFIIFIYSMADEVLKQQGREESILLLALPITVYAAAFFVFRIAVGLYVKFSPKKYAYISGILTAAASLILLFAMKHDSYTLLLAGAVAIGIGSAVGMISAKSIRLSLEPSVRYRYIVIERKGIIATAIAASLGTVLRSLFGKTAIIYFLIFLALIAIAAAYMLMEEDISISREKKRNLKSGSLIIAINRRMLRRPNTFVFMVLVALPLPFLTLLGTYVLPQINSLCGLPEVFIGAITIVVSIVSLLLNSFLWRAVDKQDDEHWPPVMMGLIAILLMLFSFITTMRLFVIILIVIALCESILLPLSFRQIIRESKEAGFDARDTSPMHEFFMAIGTVIGPVIMTAMMVLNVKLIGIVWGLICLICAVAAKRIFVRKDGN